MSSPSDDGRPPVRLAGLEIVYFHGRYYIKYHYSDGYFRQLGADLVWRIPEDPEEYQKWLASMRAKYAALEQKLEDEVYTLRPVADKEGASTDGDGDGDSPRPIEVHMPRYSVLDNDETSMVLPTALPNLDAWEGGALAVYITNLDAEVLTMDYSTHWRMDRIPRADQLWLKSMTQSIYKCAITVDLNKVPASCLASLAVPLPVRDDDGGGDDPAHVRGVRRVTLCDAHTQLAGHDKVWRVVAASAVWAFYGRSIGRFGRQWHPHDLPFRELVFAFVSLAAGRQTAFYSYARGSGYGVRCHPYRCIWGNCTDDHLKDTPGWVHPGWFVEGAERRTGPGPPLLLDFCSPLHWEGEAPGAAPGETTYWMTEDVLVHLTLVVDKTAVAEALEWGRAQRRVKRRAKHQDRDDADGARARRFYMVVLSLFNVVFAEVMEPAASQKEDDDDDDDDDDDKPDMRLSAVLRLSPLDESLCLSTHPRERRPVAEDEGISYVWNVMPHEALHNRAVHTVEEFQRHYPGTIAMVNFFAAIDSRRAAATAATTGPHLPVELYTKILDVVDYATWQTCLLVSPLFRAIGLSRYRLDDGRAVVGGPGRIRGSFVQSDEGTMTFAMRNLATGVTKTILLVEKDEDFRLHPNAYELVPVLGGHGTLKTVMLDAPVLYKTVDLDLIEKSRRKRMGEAEGSGG